jgi:hypothetical protein
MALYRTHLMHFNTTGNVLHIAHRPHAFHAPAALSHPSAAHVYHDCGWAEYSYCGHSWFSSVLPATCRHSTLNCVTPVPSTSHPIRYSLISLPHTRCSLSYSPCPYPELEGRNGTCGISVLLRGTGDQNPPPPLTVAAISVSGTASPKSGFRNYVRCDVIQFRKCRHICS